MAKTLEVKRFKVRYKNELYGPNTKNGPIIPDVDDTTADYLIKTSNGTIIEQPRVKKSLGNVKDIQPNNSLDDEQDEETEDNDNEDLQDVNSEQGLILPSVKNIGKVPARRGNES